MMRIPFAASALLIVAVRAICAGAVAFLLLPPALVLVLSFTPESIVYFPPRQWSTKLYSHVFTPEWMGPLLTSFKIAVPAAILSIIIAAPAAYAIGRRRGFVGQFCEYASLGPMLVPLASYSVGLYFVMIQLQLLGNIFGLILAHTILALPITLLILLSVLRRIPNEIELVAMSFGAGRVRAIFDTTARLLLPASLAASIFAFLTSFDDAVVVSFLGGPGAITLSKAIFDSMQFAVDPAIAAISALLMVLTAILICAALYCRRTPT